MKVKLGEVAEIIMGQSPDSSSYNYEDGLPFFQGNADFGEYYPTVRILCNKPKKIANKYDVLISVRAPVGAVNIANNTCAIGRGLAIIRTNANTVNHRYLFYLLKYHRRYIENLGTGSTFKAISKPILNDLCFTIHDIQTQKEIVVVLDKVTSLISMRKEQLEKLDILVKSKFIEMFGDPVLNPKGWEKKKLGEVCEINPNKDVFKCIDDDLEVTFLPMENVSTNGKVRTNIIKKYYEVKKGYSYFKENDVLFAKITPCMENGKSAVAKNLKNELGVGSTEFHVLRPKINYINSVWLYNLVHFKWFRLMAEYKMTGSAGQRRVPSTFLKNFITIIPPLDLQNQFSEFVEQVEKNKEKIKSSLNELETLYNALMQEYFG